MVAQLGGQRISLLQALITVVLLAHELLSQLSELVNDTSLRTNRRFVSVQELPIA